MGVGGSNREGVRGEDRTGDLRLRLLPPASSSTQPPLHHRDWIPVSEGLTGYYSKQMGSNAQLSFSHNSPKLEINLNVLQQELCR